MSASAGSAHGHGDLSHCENCHAELHGEFCHACGQSVHNPIRHVGHALEEVFESFWHLDGRIFRTLRDLLSPGRAAANYIRGHRMRYVPPLRLFVVLSVLTFFVAKFAIHFDDNQRLISFNDVQGPTVRLGNTKKQFREADSVLEVEALRTRMVKELELARQSVPEAARSPIQKSIEGVQRQADKRIEALRALQRLDDAEVAKQKAQGQREGGAAAAGSVQAAETMGAVEQWRNRQIAPLQAQLSKLAPASPQAFELAKQIRRTNAEAGCRVAALQQAHAEVSEGRAARKSDRDRYGDADCDDIHDPLSFNGKPWDAQTNPLVSPYLPKFANDWLNRQVGIGQTNISRLSKEPWRYMNTLIGAIPSALFLMVPMFALLLKLAYLGSGRGYLEHLVVALYSHAYLCLVFLAMFLLTLLGGAIAPHWPAFGIVGGTAIGLLWLWMPIYLLIMQKRVYGNGWLLTLVRYSVIGSLYFVMLSIAAVALAVTTIVRM
ncbi:DUF3667 domain-containing protein [Lysobacter sp. BMK333-48F3]|uniref:DUF3667 domain-containing protein n=1 Tax=Lysobacter sp. BMK333-48F3 TaxID=2867962 RepID=UPI001C8C878E|nr:DUF3667 domain-containing protein [Lysobacter sp. BMK333-48F3]MBX9400656.1 DUF3667 domain-containing protein [Lysobacter sp. BMK333-48F3]